MTQGFECPVSHGDLRFDSYRELYFHLRSTHEIDEKGATKLVDQVRALSEPGDLFAVPILFLIAGPLLLWLATHQPAPVALTLQQAAQANANGSLALLAIGGALLVGGATLVSWNLRHYLESRRAIG